MTKSPRVSQDDVVRLWFHRQGLAEPRGTTKLSKRTLTAHLEQTGALQIDSVNVVDRAHYLTLWSRFGLYDRKKVDGWIYGDRIAYEYWGHEASILPISHLRLGQRRMRRFPSPAWKSKAWWSRYDTSAGSKRRVLRRIEGEGPLESADFERQPTEVIPDALPGWAASYPKEDKRSLKVLWHAGRLGISKRRHFRCVYDLAERVYPEAETASQIEVEDTWLFAALSGNGVASERHLVNYFTTPTLKAADRKRILARNLRKKRIVSVEVDGQHGTFYALAEDLESLGDLPDPHGTNLLCPFDSFLWQRKRAEDLLDFEYRIEIYVPAAKRRFGYYVLPILHDGKLVGRLDPKLHRDRALLEIRALHFEPGFKKTKKFELGLTRTLHDLAAFLGAGEVKWSRGATALD